MEVVGSEDRLSAGMLKMADRIQKEELTDEEKDKLKSSINDLFTQMQKEAKSA